MSLKKRLGNFLIVFGVLALFVFFADLASLEDFHQWPALLVGLGAFSLGVMLHLSPEPAGKGGSGASPPPPPPKPTPKPAAPPAPKKPGLLSGLLKPKTKPAPPPGKAGPPARPAPAAAKPKKK